MARLSLAETAGTPLGGEIYVNLGRSETSCGCLVDAVVGKSNDGMAKLLRDMVGQEPQEVDEVE